ncbi:MAG: hypothetical protein EPO13_06445 [Actinomycetota bacterium]|nr:MAG: hypothetical protein EPO13_06445 [Actinomycetota bacterium]
MDSLTPAEFAALGAGIVRFLEIHGIELGSTPWLKALGEGLHEFRVRHDAATIKRLAGHERDEGLPTQKKILLRLFVHFYGDRAILLLHGYDKGGDDSQRQQNREIREARKRLTAWRAAEANRAKRQKG